MTLASIAPERARRIAAGFAGLDLLVVGDAMLDRFLVGRVTRISPEAPVPVVAFDHETVRLGGAANVAHNINALGGHAVLVALTGQDDAAAALTLACRDAGIAPSLVSDPGRRTTTKVRIVTERKQQVARVDYEDDTEAAGDVEDRIVAAVERHAAQARAVVVSDYLKGAVTRRIAQAAVAAGARAGIPVLVDPKVPHVEYYRGSSVVTPNHHEAETATHLRIRTEADAGAAARAFQTRAGCDAVLMTRGDQGMWLLARDAEGMLPASARDVADVTGAGDTVIATMAMALAAGATLAEAACLANQAAGLSVARFGPATVSAAELLRAIGA